MISSSNSGGCGGTARPISSIANLLGISRQAVSRALLVMDEKIESTLREMAQANQIAIEKVNAERGVLIGRSIPFQTAAIIFVSEKHGMQVWYEHDGDCGACQRYTECIESALGLCNRTRHPDREDR